MRVAIITPFYMQSTRGNAVTVRRIERYLIETGCVIAVFSLDMHSAGSLSEAVRAFSPDIIHAFHAVHSGFIAKKLANELSIPYLITLTGTDILTDYEVEPDAVFMETVKSAAALVFFAAGMKGRFTDLHPGLESSSICIPQGVEVPINMSPELPCNDAFIFFLPAGIRPVKNILFPFAPLAELGQKHPQIRLVIAGPLIDNDYGRQLLAEVASHPFSSWLGEVDNSSMPALYDSAHVVLNTSLSEGGMANSILEGMAFGRPVLVSDIAGNRSLVNDEENGFIFSSEKEFYGKAKRLLLDKGLRKRVGAAGRAYVLRNCSPVVEATSYLELYMKILEPAVYKGV